MVRKCVIVIITAVFLCLNTAVSMAVASGTAVLLSDEELDQIYAQGFNFSGFNDFLGNFDKIFMPPALNFTLEANGDATLFFSGDRGSSPIFSTGSGDINYINLQDYAQQFANSLINVNAAGSNVLVGLNLNVIINSTIAGNVMSNNNLIIAP